MSGAGQDGFVYGVLCFAAGFVFGAFREMVLIPAFGSGAGRLIELPLVTLTAVALAWGMVRLRPHRARRVWLAIGLAGVATLLALESALALLILRVPLSDYVAGYDVTEGSLFPVGLAIMLCAPAIIATAGRR